MNITFTVLATEHNITIPIHNDDVVEATEQLFVHLKILSSKATGFVLLNPDRATVFIRNEYSTLGTYEYV